MTPEQLERRRKVVGASEVAMLFGLPTYGGKTVSDLWWEKKYGVEKSNKGNKSTEAGNLLEPTILQWAEQKLETQIADRQLWLTRGCVGATLDGRAVSTGNVIEAKSAGVVWRQPTDDWGPDDSDETPDNYLIQVQAQLLVSQSELGHLAALIGGRGFAMFNIRPQHELMKAIEVKAAEFIQSLESDEPPTVPPQLDTLKRIRRQPNKVVPGSDEIELYYREWNEWKNQANDLDKRAEKAQRELLALLGDAEAAECGDGMLTYFEQTRKESVTAASTFRVLRFKKGKS